jgi:ubiquinone/menaquinone biosynthesis C-methylase UbiE
MPGPRVLSPLVHQIYSLVRPLQFRRQDECAVAIRWLDAQHDERILDVGCGDGYYDRKLVIRSNCRVEAIDARPHRIATARVRNPHPNVRYYVMSGEHLGFQTASFDKVLSLCVLEHIRDDHGSLKEMARVLRPGGRLVITCDSLSNRGVSDALRQAHSRRYAVWRFYTRERLAAALQQVGFTVLRSTYVLTTSVSLAITRLTYLLDEVGALPGGWIVKYPGYGIAATLGRVVSGLSERVAPRHNEGLTLVVEAQKDARPVLTGSGSIAATDSHAL